MGGGDKGGCDVGGVCVIYSLDMIGVLEDVLVHLCSNER